jgi:tetratricopeptide (TPR) repeat protein
LEKFGQRSEALKIYQNICDGQLPQSKEYLEALSRLAGCQIQMGNYEAGIPNLENALSVIETFSQTHSDLQLTELKTQLLENLALYRMNAGRFDEAFNLFGEVFNLREQNQLVTGQVQPLAHQGILLRKSAAPRQYLASLLVVNSLRLLKLNWLATPLQAQLCQPFMLRITQNYERAEELLGQAYRLCEELKDENAAAWIAHHIAWVTINRGEAASAEEYARIALEQYEHSGDQRGISDCHEQLGRIYLAKGRQYLDEAEYHFNQSLTIRKSIINLHGMASSTLNFAFLYWHKGHYLQSIRHLIQGMQGYRQIHLLSFSRVLAILTLFSVWTAGNRDWTM